MSFNRLKMAFFQGVAAMLGPPLAGVLVEATGHQGPALQVHLMLGSESLGEQGRALQVFTFSHACCWVQRAFSPVMYYLEIGS